MRQVDAELVEQPVFLLGGGTVVGIEVEHVHLYLRAVILAHDELLQVVGDRLGLDAECVEYLRRGGRWVGGDELQRMTGRYAAGRGDVFPQLLGECTVEFFGFGFRSLRSLRRLQRHGIRNDDGLLDAQTHLMQLPVLQSGRKQLIGERSLLADQFECEKVFERVTDGRLCRMECGTGDEPFERFRDFHLHISSSFHSPI